MTKSKYQRAKSKEQRAKRLLPLGFVCLGFVLFVVLLCACNGGYEPEVGGEDVIIPVYSATHELASVIVKIPGKIAYDFNQGKNDGYAVVWDPNVGSVNADTGDGHGNGPISNGDAIYKTTYFTFSPLTVPTITFSVYKCILDSSSAPIPGPLVATKVIPTSNAP